MEIDEEYLKIVSRARSFSAEEISTLPHFYQADFDRRSTKLEKKGGSLTQDQVPLSSSDGVSHSIESYKQICSEAKDILGFLFEKSEREESWGRLCAFKRKRAVYILESLFPDVSLCDGHWQATLILSRKAECWNGGKKKREKPLGLASKRTNVETTKVSAEEQATMAS